LAAGISKPVWHAASYGSVAQRIQVLLVDDDASIRKSLTKALRLDDFDVFAAATLEEAFSQFKQQPIDIVLLDINLGSGNGWDLLQQLRALQPGLPAIMMTGNANDIHRGSNCGIAVQALLEKPFDPPALFQKLRDSLSSQTPLRQETQTSPA
jgi:DNA-binding response OmpR family regulator